jgi:hypothetical protein
MRVGVALVWTGTGGQQDGFRPSEGRKHWPRVSSETSWSHLEQDNNASERGQGDISLARKHGHDEARANLAALRSSSRRVKKTASIRRTISPTLKVRTGPCLQIRRVAAEGPLVGVSCEEARQLLFHRLEAALTFTQICQARSRGLEQTGHGKIHLPSRFREPTSAGDESPLMPAERTPRPDANLVTSMCTYSLTRMSMNVRPTR